LAVAEKRVPARLSLLGSLRLLNRAEQVLTLKDPTSLFQAAAAINRQRPLLAPEVQVVWDALAARLEAKRRLLSGGTVMGDGQAKAKQAEQSYEIAVQTLNLIPEVQEAREKLAREP
jgi:hypothetical protein